MEILHFWGVLINKHNAVSNVCAMCHISCVNGIMSMLKIMLMYQSISNFTKQVWQMI